ncbi:MAG TPA: hypothetical protein VM598_09055 [Bdellovibrionota bacterium]|nr:hypothetical protein [Bdellovibrionota bacterium]
MILLTLATLAIATVQADELRYPLFHSTGYVPGTGTIEVSSLPDGRLQVVVDRNTCEVRPDGRVRNCTESPASLSRVRAQAVTEPGARDLYDLSFGLRLQVFYTHDGPAYQIGDAIFEEREYGYTIVGYRWTPLLEAWKVEWQRRP